MSAEPTFPPVSPPTQAELAAIDRTYAIAKDNGVLERLREYCALRDQVRLDALVGGAS